MGGPLEGRQEWQECKKKGKKGEEGGKKEGKKERQGELLRKKRREVFRFCVN